MSLAQRLQHEYEQLLDRVSHFVTVVSRVVLEGLHAFERLAVGVDKLQSNVERQQEFESIECCVG